MPSFRVVSQAEDYVWPSGRPDFAAVVSIQPDQLEGVIGQPLVSGTEEGLGHWVGIGLQLPSGRMVELVRYEHGSLPGFYLMIDSADDPQAARSETVQALGLPKDAFEWIKA
jgi:hypothetical protein